MVDFPNGTPALPDIATNDPPGIAAGGLGIRTLVNRANDNILALINQNYQNPEGYMNPVINGGPEVWPEGTTFAAAANLTYGPEMWRWITIGAGVVTILQSTDVPAVGANCSKILFSTQVDVTTVDSSIAAGDAYILEYLMEGCLWSALAQREFTIRFWVKSSKTGIHCVSFSNNGVDRSYVAEYTVNTVNTWEEKSITVSASPSAGTWSYTTSIGLRIRFALAMGSTYHTTPNSWATGSFYSTANQVNCLDNVANDFRVCGLSARPGPYCGPYVQRPYALEEFLCKRYLLFMGPGMFGSTSNSLGDRMSIGGMFGVSMRTIPTLTLIDTSIDVVVPEAAVATSSSSTITFSTISAEGMYATVNGFGTSFSSYLGRFVAVSQSTPVFKLNARM